MVVLDQEHPHHGLIVASARAVGANLKKTQAPFMQSSAAAPWAAPMSCRVIGLVLAGTLSMTIAEFIEFQKLSPEDLRTRLSLPAACDPAMTASTPDTAQNLVIVGVGCRGQPAESPANRPGERARPPRPAPRGS
jgi:hypothetical protein